MSRSYTDGFSSCNDPRCLVSLSAYVRSSRTACLRITVYAWVVTLCKCNRSIQENESIVFTIAKFRIYAQFFCPIWSANQ